LRYNFAKGYEFLLIIYISPRVNFYHDVFLLRGHQFGMHTLVGFEHSTGREMVILVIDLEIILVIICRLGNFAMYNSNSNSIDNFGCSIRL